MMHVNSAVMAVRFFSSHSNCSIMTLQRIVSSLKARRKTRNSFYELAHYNLPPTFVGSVTVNSPCTTNRRVI